MAPQPPSSDDQKPAPADDPELTKKLVLEAVAPLSGGKAAAGAAYPAVYQVGSTDTITAVYRSDDGARTWARINDDRRQWGWIGATIAADPRVYGRVYIATNGRGIQYGEPV